jgi:hypothetical protein
VTIKHETQKCKILAVKATLFSETCKLFLSYFSLATLGIAHSDWGLIPGRARDFSLSSVQTGPGVHPASFSVGTTGSICGGGLK